MPNDVELDVTIPLHTLNRLIEMAEPRSFGDHCNLVVARTAAFMTKRDAELAEKITIPLVADEQPSPAEQARANAHLCSKEC